LGKIWEKRKKEGKQMSLKLNRDYRILFILVTLVVVALLATIWAINAPFGSPLERQGWERLNLSEEHRIKIEQLIKNMTKNGSSIEEIQTAVNMKLEEWGVQPPPPGDIELFYTIKTVISTVNITLVTILLLTYIDIYRRTKASFTIGLIIFSTILLLYTITSNPILQWPFGFRAFGLGPFAMLPDLFTCVALSILVYLSVKY
jgi:hypothetical protein